MEWEKTNYASWQSKKCKELYGEVEILGLKKEIKSIRNKRYKVKPENKTAGKKYNKSYNENIENKRKKKEYNLNNNKIYYKKIMSKKRSKSYEKYLKK